MWPIHINIIIIICITSIVTIYHSNVFNSANSNTHTPLHQSRSARKPPLLSVLDKTSSTVSSIHHQQQLSGQQLSDQQLSGQQLGGGVSGGWNKNSIINNNSVMMSNSMTSGSSSSSSSKNMRMMFDEDASKVLVLLHLYHIISHNLWHVCIQKRQ
jgi:hypothetical protein